MSPHPSSASVPDYVASLQAIYGLPSQNGFGSAVFYESVDSPEHLESVALKIYRHFVGDLWERWGEAAWMTPWKQVYRRSLSGRQSPDAPCQIVTELESLSDVNVTSSASMLLTSPEDPKAAKSALSVTYDAATVADLVIYAIGDGAAMSGVLVAGRRDSGAAVFLIFLLD